MSYIGRAGDSYAPLTDTKAITIDGSPVVQTQPGVESLIDDGVARSREEMRQLHRRSAFVDDKPAHCEQKVGSSEEA